MQSRKRHWPVVCIAWHSLHQVHARSMVALWSNVWKLSGRASPVSEHDVHLSIKYALSALPVRTALARGVKSSPF